MRGRRDALSSAARTHVGTVRWRNEDAVIERAEVGLWAVADGAGGHERGDYASSRIIAALREVDAAQSDGSLSTTSSGALRRSTAS
jgi:serine/threonine protein phosphatase PrpC